MCLDLKDCRAHAIWAWECFNMCLRWRLPGSRGFEAIANKAIRPATKIHLLHHVISVYVIIKMAVAHTTAHCLVTRRICYCCVSIIREDIH